MANASPVFEPEKFYHVWSHAIGSENLFRENENYLFFLARYSHHLSPVVNTYAYCLMPNHFHLLIRVKENSKISVSKAFSNLLNSYTQSFNKMYNRKGGLFISNLKRKAIESEDYFTRCITYIHQNPMHHGFTDNFQTWKFSSMATILSDRPTKIEREEVLDWFGGKSGFLKDHSVPVPIQNIILFECDH